jgi:hypothetical protein
MDGDFNSGYSGNVMGGGNSFAATIGYQVGLRARREGSGPSLAELYSPLAIIGYSALAILGAFLGMIIFPLFGAPPLAGMLFGGLWIYILGPLVPLVAISGFKLLVLINRVPLLLPVLLIDCPFMIVGGLWARHLGDPFFAGIWRFGLVGLLPALVLSVAPRFLFRRLIKTWTAIRAAPSPAAGADASQKTRS